MASFPPKVRSFGFEMAAERLDIEEFFRKIDLRVIMNILSANFGETCRYGPLNFNCLTTKHAMFIAN